ncbi:head-tail connector protein [Allosphingosinicella indica]|uniref:Phage gp6-like head-tail connector protein n=1 Tax=Allosphingosinicella indica TaxID=941907 RepID=A0A1X7GJ85_9SPHN|nr:head-tail connector protein [Allosphingosinicella indica]SMF70542.1 phage conserved hypothetical protein, phiE125 gp8 family [Allosphingosinicella indica]
MIRAVTPAPLVIGVAEAKQQLRIDHDDEDALLEGQLAAAQEWVEMFTSQVLTPRTLLFSAAGFPQLPEMIVLARAPVTGVTAISFTTAEGEEIDLLPGNWRWSEDAPELVRPAFGSPWPSAAAEAGSVRLRVSAGYDEGLAPRGLVTAVLMLAGHFFANREGSGAVPEQVKDLCRPFRRFSLGL